MEKANNFEEIKELWFTYDQKLESLEAGNKKILNHLIAQKVTKKIGLMNFRSTIGAILSPLLLLMVLLPFGLTNKMFPWTGIGLGVVAILFIFRFILGLKFLTLTYRLKIDQDPVIITQKKILDIEKHGLTIEKLRKITYPILAGGFVLVFWNRIPYPVIFKSVFFILFIIGLYFWGTLKFKLHFKDKLDLLNADIEELSRKSD